MAATLGEPVRNFGVGGFSVYQAYRRMLREEEVVPAEHIVFNIFDVSRHDIAAIWVTFFFKNPDIVVDRAGRVPDGRAFDRRHPHGIAQQLRRPDRPHVEDDLPLDGR